MACITCRSRGDGGHRSWCPENGSVVALGDWIGDALCGVIGPDKFETLTPAAVKSFCSDCPVRLECLRFGIASDEPGIYGGFTTMERRRDPDVRKLVMAGGNRA